MSPPVRIRPDNLFQYIGTYLARHPPTIQDNTGIKPRTMTIHTVNVTRLRSAAAEDYFTRRADRRVMIGLRATLELLNLPVPEWAIRRKPGMTPARNIERAYRADNPAPLVTTLAPRRPNASASSVANARD